MSYLRARERGIITGELPPGPLNRITDVEGIKVGHCTVADGGLQTGVTVLMPPDNPFTESSRRPPTSSTGLARRWGSSRSTSWGRWRRRSPSAGR